LNKLLPPTGIFHSIKDWVAAKNGSNGAIITPDNHLIWDVSFEDVHITPETHSIFQKNALPEAMTSP
jgi:hypothetical protein